MMDTQMTLAGESSPAPVALEVCAKMDSAASCSGDSLDDHHHLAPRKSNRWGATAHIITAMLGAGVLGLPSTFAYLGWAGGIITLGSFLIISWFTFTLLVKMHEVPPNTTGRSIKRLDTYKDLSCYLLGPKRGFWALVPFQTIMLYGLAITYTVTGAGNMQSVSELQGGLSMNHVSYYVLIFSACQLVLSLVPNFSELSWVSAMGAAMSILYCLLAMVLSPMYHTEPRDTVNYQVGTAAGQTQTEFFYGVFSGLSTVTFAFGCHTICLEIQATLPAAHNESTIPPMMFSSHMSFVLTGAAYFAVAITGFWAYGTAVTSNILDSIGQPNGAITAAHMAVVLHVLASYQVISFPLFDSMELLVTQRFPGWQLATNSTRRFFVRTGIRWVYVGTTALIACVIPFFGDLMSLFGAISTTPTVFVLPCVLWLYWKRPGICTFEFWLTMVVAVIMTLVGVLGAIAAVRSISLNASTYKPFT